MLVAFVVLPRKISSLTISWKSRWVEDSLVGPYFRVYEGESFAESWHFLSLARQCHVGVFYSPASPLLRILSFLIVLLICKQGKLSVSTSCRTYFFLC